MVPPLRFTGWEWLALALATPVVFYSGLNFHRAALRSARHAAATMDTLISLGTLAAWAWSTVVLVGGLDGDTYFEVAAAITTLILLGRYLEVRAKGRSSQAIRRLLELGAKDARVLRNGEEVLVPGGRARVLRAEFEEPANRLDERPFARTSGLPPSRISVVIAAATSK